MIYAHKETEERGREGEGGRWGGFTKGSQCVKCLPCSENALVMIIYLLLFFSVMASSAEIVFNQKSLLVLSLRARN